MDIPACRIRGGKSILVAAFIFVVVHQGLSILWRPLEPWPRHLCNIIEWVFYWSKLLFSSTSMAAVFLEHGIHQKRCRQSIVLKKYRGGP